MLAEWFRHLTTPGPAHLRRMGYLKELIAIEARYRRQRGTWQPHLDACKKLILEAAKGVEPDRVTVLGSGLLLDVPLRELSEKFTDVRLVDIFHMPDIEKRVTGMTNVTLVTTDLTGLVEATFRHVNEGRTGPLPPPLPPTPADAGMFADSDLLISLNLLSQLPLLPMGWVQKNSTAYDEATIKSFARRIVDHHLEFLMALPGRVVLITETERVISDGDEVLQEIDSLFGLGIKATHSKKWTWNIAPRPEITRHIDLRFRMAGIIDLKGGSL